MKALRQVTEKPTTYAQRLNQSLCSLMENRTQFLFEPLQIVMISNALTQMVFEFSHLVDVARKHENLEREAKYLDMISVCEKCEKLFQVVFTEGSMNQKALYSQQLINLELMAENKRLQDKINNMEGFS